MAATDADQMRCIQLSFRFLSWEYNRLGNPGFLVIQDRAPKRKPDELGQDEVSVGRAGRKTAETLNATDRIIEALELAGKEAERLQVSPTSHLMSSFFLVGLLQTSQFLCSPAIRLGPCTGVQLVDPTLRRHRSQRLEL